MASPGTGPRIVSVETPHTHAFGDLEEDGEDLVLVCSCGWRSPPARTAARLGSAWDEHRAARG